MKLKEVAEISALKPWSPRLHFVPRPRARPTKPSTGDTHPLDMSRWRDDFSVFIALSRRCCLSSPASSSREQALNLIVPKLVLSARLPFIS